VLGIERDIGELTKDQSIAAEWKQNDTITLPQDCRYSNCILKLKSKEDSARMGLTELEQGDKQVLQLALMYEPVHLCFFQYVAGNTEVQGLLRLKFSVQHLFCLDLHKKDKKTL